MYSLLLASYLTLICALSPIATFASSADLSPAISDLSKNFSEIFCLSVKNGLSPEKAGETTAVQLSKGLLFSPVINEIMSTPKKDLAESLSNNIFDGCGNNLGGTKKELDSYLIQLANKIPNKTTNRSQLPPIRQMPSK